MLCSCVNNLYNQSYTSISSKKTTALLEKTIILFIIITPQNTKGKYGREEEGYFFTPR